MKIKDVLTNGIILGGVLSGGSIGLIANEVYELDQANTELGVVRELEADLVTYEDLKTSSHGLSEALFDMFDTTKPFPNYGTDEEKTEYRVLHEAHKPMAEAVDRSIAVNNEGLEQNRDITDITNRLLREKESARNDIKQAGGILASGLAVAGLFGSTLFFVRKREERKQA